MNSLSNTFADFRSVFPIINGELLLGDIDLQATLEWWNNNYMMIGLLTGVQTTPQDILIYGDLKKLYHMYSLAYTAREKLSQFNKNQD